jgi:hypothetical protein
VPFHALAQFESEGRAVLGKRSGDLLIGPRQRPWKRDEPLRAGRTGGDRTRMRDAIAFFRCSELRPVRCTAARCSHWIIRSRWRRRSVTPHWVTRLWRRRIARGRRTWIILRLQTIEFPSIQLVGAIIAPGIGRRHLLAVSARALLAPAAWQRRRRWRVPVGRSRRGRRRVHWRRWRGWRIGRARSGGVRVQSRPSWIGARHIHGVRSGANHLRPDGRRSGESRAYRGAGQQTFHALDPP